MNNIVKFLPDQIRSQAITMGILAGVWSLICCGAGWDSWIGFAGCTAYFASGLRKAEGIKTALITSESGAIWAFICMFLGTIIPSQVAAAVFCAAITYFMIVQSKIKPLTFIPGTFIGCFSTFASGGDYKIFFILVLGIIMGFLADVSGEWLGNRMAAIKESK